MCVGLRTTPCPVGCLWFYLNVHVRRLHLAAAASALQKPLFCSSPAIDLFSKGGLYGRQDPRWVSVCVKVRCGVSESSVLKQKSQSHSGDPRPSCFNEDTTFFCIPTPLPLLFFASEHLASTHLLARRPPACG